MAGPARLAAVPEESPDGFTAVLPPHNLFRDSIRSVALSGPQIRSTPFSHSRSSHNESSHSSDSGASSSYPSDNTGSSLCLASAAATQFSAQELTRIARLMVTDGYIQRMVQAFEYGGEPERALETWFFELDVDWVLRIHDEDNLQWALQVRSMRTIQEQVERWIRALTVIVVSITELVFTDDETPEVVRFGKASISAMLVFVDSIVDADGHKVEKLQAVLPMYVCSFSVSYDMSTMHLSSPEARSIFNEIGGSLDREGNMLNKAIHIVMKEVRARIEDDDWWAIDIIRGRGDVHRHTRFMVDCIMSMVSTGLGVKIRVEP